MLEVCCWLSDYVPKAGSSVEPAFCDRLARDGPFDGYAGFGQSLEGRHRPAAKGVIPPRDGPSWYQVVGGVAAHQAIDAYRACERGPAHWD